MVRIAILDDYAGAAERSADWNRLRVRGAEVEAFADHLEDPDAVVARLAPFDAVCVMRERTRLTGAMLERLPRLRFIGSNGAVNPAIDADAARARGIVVCGTGGRPNGTPELTWALILAAARGLPAELGAVRAGTWQQGIGADLAERTLGVVGLGRIGSRVAAVGRAFGMEVIAWSRNLSPEAAAAAGAVRVEKEELFRRADWVTLHLVLSDRSRNTVGAAELSLMKPTAWLVNTARGPLVEEAALVAALERRAIAGAALDVFDREPLPAGHPFRTLPNVLASPHVGYATADTYAAFHGETVENLLAWMDGSPIRAS